MASNAPRIENPQGHAQLLHNAQVQLAAPPTGLQGSALWVVVGKAVAAVWGFLKEMLACKARPPAHSPGTGTTGSEAPSYCTAAHCPPPPCWDAGALPACQPVRLLLPASGWVSEEQHDVSMQPISFQSISTAFLPQQNLSRSACAHTTPLSCSSFGPAPLARICNGSRTAAVIL